ncbi:protein lplB, partial [Paenibacillus rigui]
MKAVAIHRMKVYWPLYVMAIPGIVFLIVFKYIPLAGAVIAFKDYSVFKGFIDSPWVGLKHFKTLIHHPDFFRVFGNTLMLGFLKLVLVFPVPVLLALMINEIRKAALKKGIQTALYIPHFLSWVIVAGIVFDFFSLSGLFNIILGWFGFEPLLAMKDSTYFRPV